MQRNDSGLPYIEIHRASKHLKYQHAKPEGALLVLYCFVSVFLLMFIQNSFFGANPDLVLVFVFLAGVKCRPRRALLLGLLSGLAMDVFYGRYIGVYGILYMYAAILACLLSEKVLNTRPRVIVAGIPLFFVFGVLESFIIRFISVVVGEGTVMYTNYWVHFTDKILPGVFINTLTLAAMIYPVYILWRRLSPH